MGMAEARVSVTVRLGVDEYEALRAYAVGQNATVNDTMRALLRVALDHCGVKLEPLPEVGEGKS